MKCRLLLSIPFFFFQAEDGIRDADVTGVQTCALPICNYVVFNSGRVEDTACLNIGGNLIKTDRSGSVTKIREPAKWVVESLFGEALTETRLSPDHLERSEERRVGKEGRCRWWLCQ